MKRENLGENCLLALHLLLPRKLALLLVLSADSFFPHSDGAFIEHLHAEVGHAGELHPCLQVAETKQEVNFLSLLGQTKLLSEEEFIKVQYA